MSWMSIQLKRELLYLSTLGLRWDGSLPLLVAACSNTPSAAARRSQLQVAEGL